MADNQMVRVLSDYTYTPKEGADPVHFKQDEEYILYKQTNEEWWCVYKKGCKPVFVPAKYVEMIDKKAKKDHPPKPPKVAPKPPKKLDPEIVLKELDDMLDMVVDIDDAEEAGSKDNKADDISSTKEEKSENTSQTASTPGDDSSHSANSESVQEETTESTDSVNTSELQNKAAISKGSASENSKTDTEQIYANFEALASASAKPKSTASLDRNVLSKPPTEFSHGRSASVSGGVTGLHNGESRLKKLPKPEPRLSGTKYYEEPQYANLETLSAKCCPPPPKQAASKKKRDDGSSDEDDGVPDYANVAEMLRGSPQPSQPPPERPPPGATVIRSINTQWVIYKDDDTQKPYYYNSTTRETSWSPPAIGEPDEIKDSSAHSRVSTGSLPAGWTVHHTDEGDVFYTNQFSNDKWLSSTDDTGQVYYYKEGSSESSWELPESPSTVREDDEETGTSGEPLEEWSQGSETELSVQQVGTANIPSQARVREMQTYLNKTKVAENGKKVKKNWSQCWVITTGKYMYFYKDQKSAQPKQNLPFGKFEAELELLGATVTLAPKELSSKKNVILISTLYGTQYLLQSDDKAKIEDWYNTLLTNIALLGMPTSPHGSVVPESTPTSPGLQNRASKMKKPNKKTCTLERPNTPDDTLSVSEKNSKIKDWLLYWLLRRPTAESLKEKGIIKDGIFGSHIQSICDREKVLIPRFVNNCIVAVDARGLTVDGIYRISGNMANIQKLRFRVDHNEPYDLMSSDIDVHDITGALKLFFRELQEPLFPFNTYEKFTKAFENPDGQNRIKVFQDTVKELPKVNFCTLRELMVHLTKVVENRKHNRMEAKNVAIVFGPTLMRPSSEWNNMAANLVMQGQVIEFMINNYKKIF